MPNSAWTETGVGIDLVPVTTPIDDAQQQSPDYLTNSDKIALMAQWAAELNTKTQLDTTAANLGVSSTTYDNAVAAISTNLIADGAPSDWQTAWPDGTTFGPVTGIKTSLGNWWSQVATQRTILQTYISSQQAANAQAAATAAAATNTVDKINVMALSNPTAATWASTAKPTLPNASYPAGSCWLATDGLEFQVSVDGSLWEAVTVAATGLFGQVVASQLTLTDLTNLCKNPTWESGDDSWINASGYTTLTTGGRTTGCLRIDSPSGGTVAVRNINYVPCTPGQTYNAEVWVANQATSGSVYVRLEGINSAGTEIWTDNGNAVSAGANGGAYTLSSISAQVPANVVQCRLELVVDALTGGATWLSDCFFRRLTDASLIVDGTITSSKIAAGAITADMITTGTLDASAVTVTNINASNITTGTLSADKIEFSDGSVLSSASRTKINYASPAADIVLTNSDQTLSGVNLGSTVASGQMEVWVIMAIVAAYSPNGQSGNDLNISLWVDGVEVKTTTANNVSLSEASPTLAQTVPYTVVFTPGAHTITVKANYTGTNGVSVVAAQTQLMGARTF